VAVASAGPYAQITTPAPHHSVFFTGRIPFLPPNQQHQSTEGLNVSWKSPGNWLAWICRHTVCGVVFEVSTRSSVTAEDSREATVRGVGVDKEQSVRDRWI